MKRIPVFIIALLLLQNIYAQSLTGKWTISSLIDTGDYLDAYVLLPTQPQVYDYGHILILNPDGTFRSHRVPGCGQDRYPPSTYGKYTVLDNNYIRFFLEKKHEQEEIIYNKDLGSYYYYPQAGGFGLLKSSGNLERDKQVVYYRDLLTTKDKEIKAYEHILNWEPTKIKDVQEAVSGYLTAAGMKNFEILYAQPVTKYDQTIFLIKTGNSLRYVIYDKTYNRIALYDDTRINSINRLTADIDGNNQLKTRPLKLIHMTPGIPAENQSIIVYESKKNIQKAVYNQNFIQGGGWYTTIYFENGLPVYVTYEERTASEGTERSSKIGCYLLDTEQRKIITKTIRSEQGSIHFPDLYYKQAMDNINQQP